MKYNNGIIRNIEPLMNKPKINDVVVVTTYFNPFKFKSKLNNYKKFRNEIEKSSARLITVELAFGDNDFELNEFLDIIQLRTGNDNVFWHRERLWNIGIIELIKQGYDKIAFIDADIIFEDDNWVNDLIKELDKNIICQLFKDVIRIESLEGDKKIYPSITRNYNESGNFNLLGQTGFAWAARSELFKEILLYDCAIVGGADELLFFGCFFHDPQMINKINKTQYLKKLNPLLYNHYLNWAYKFGSIVKGRIGYIDHTIKALYHGTLKSRGYLNRHNILIRNHYDPLTDIKMGSDGVYNWTYKNKALNKEVKDYFKSREEDY